MDSASVEAFVDEMEKISGLTLRDHLKVVGPGLLAGTVFAAGILSRKKNRERLGKEIRDPRLYSNLRGMATLESRNERVGAHKKLDRTNNRSILSAMREGFTRGGKKEK